MNYKIPNHLLDLLMPLAREHGVSPTKLIEQAILQTYNNKEDNVCHKSTKK
ncbi:hypothetical protein [Salinivibrio proteolyticus]|uniref:hypothetical protein n=1 Tax=Salinivibrio proteolyticus TaxID=334715 RepID=UPI0012FF9488|nr:hypothetical protein [Salinivibrio proteolyticus]